MVGMVDIPSIHSEILVKLLALNLLHNLESLKKELLTSDKREQLYMACDGLTSMTDLQTKAGVSRRMAENNLPEWEKRGLIISVGYGVNKRYLALENMSIYLAHLAKDDK